MTRLQRIRTGDAELVADFLTSMTEGDRTFFKEPVDVETVRRWGTEASRPRWLLVDNTAPVAYVAVIPGVGWSAHVGELRLLVAPAHRRRGLGTRLARHALLAGVEMGLEKLTVEVAADKVGDLEMFTAIGFEPEGILRGHIRDRTGVFRDLVILSHQVRDVMGDLGRVGLDMAVGLEVDLDRPLGGAPLTEVARDPGPGEAYVDQPLLGATEQGQ